MTAAVLAESASHLKVAALYLVLIAIHLVAPDRSGDPDDNDWLAESDTGHAFAPASRSRGIGR